MEKILECQICNQGFLFEMDNTICSICEEEFERKLEEEQIEMARADLFDETTNDLPPFFPWGRKDNTGFEHISMKNPLERI